MTANGGVGSITFDLETLVARVRVTFPDLSFTQAELEDRGGDHCVLLLDNEYAFRFPRTPDHHLGLELAVLSALQGRCVLPTPHYEFVAPDCSFAGYRFLPGIELTPALFATLRRPVQNHILDQAVLMLNTLHSLEPNQIAGEQVWRMTWTAVQFTKRGRQRLATIERSFPALAGEIAAFYCVYENDRAPLKVVLHGDLTEDHLLLSTDRDRLAGIIDFGDVGLGDPADDLKGFWAFGAGAVAHVLKGYSGRGADPGLLERSRHAYLRYRIDRFAELLCEDGPVPITAEAGRLHRLLIGIQDK